MLIATNIPPMWLLFAQVMDDRRARRSSAGMSSQHIPLHDDPGRLGTPGSSLQDCKNSQVIPPALLSHEAPAFPRDGIVQRRDLIVELEIRSVRGNGSQGGYSGVATSAVGSDKFQTEV